jgi:hypothetical protein
VRSVETATAPLTEARSAELTTALNIDAAERPIPSKNAADEAQHEATYATDNSTQLQKADLIFHWLKARGALCSILLTPVSRTCPSHPTLFA